MANTLKLKRSAIQDRVPTTGDLQLGELALNTYDGKLYTKKDNGTVTIVEIGANTFLSGGTLTGNLNNTSTGYLQVSVGTTAQRTAGNNGYLRYNTTLGCLESFAQGAWQIIANTNLDYGLITSASTTTFDYGAIA